jgi:hypothetical protein
MPAVHSEDKAPTVDQKKKKKKKTHRAQKDEDKYDKINGYA